MMSDDHTKEAKDIATLVARWRNGLGTSLPPWAVMVEEWDFEGPFFDYEGGIIDDNAALWEIMDESYASERWECSERGGGACDG